VSKSADPTRATTPVPTCVQLLPGRATSGFSRQIPERDYWNLIVPGLAQNPAGINRETTACNGVPVFGATTFDGAQLDAAAIEQGRITYGGGANRLKVVWLRTHVAATGEQAGPLALVRVLENYAEVYGVGAFRGDAEKSRFGLERLGGDLVVTAISDGCAAAKPGGDCDTILVAYLPTGGRLAPLAVVGLERARFATGLEPGVLGPLKFHMTSSPSFQADGVHVVEEVTVTDEVGRTVRRAQLERTFTLHGADLSSSSESLWDRIYESRLTAARGTAAPARAVTVERSAGSQPNRPAVPNAAAQ
jgi:hypothetical protein